MLNKNVRDAMGEAEGRIEGPIQAACIVMSRDFDERGGPWSGGHWSVLLLTTDELCVFSMRAAGWRRPNTSVIDTELMRVPLNEVARFAPRFSIHPLAKAFNLAFTDGRRMTLWVGRG